ncbi:MAG: tetraacyldisaccharide 4'-kinase [Deltaproteobacteria bacterium]|nr:tetraacyldisaccharide 4'-kinase [Deltaproteobacteria bacterium]
MTTVEQTPKPSRSPWQLFYGAGHRLRYAYYQRRGRRLPRPVISVGNLHWGGGGKTPLVASLAAHLRDMDLAVAVLSRGYKRKGRGVQVVSHGDGPLLGPSLAGDEPVLLAGEVRGVSLLVGEDRYEAGIHALERLDPEPQIFLLDDGFSHLRLRRDLDLLAFPSSDPFAGGRLFPGGRLREPLSSASRAHGVLLTGSSGDPQAGKRLAEALNPFGFRGQGFSSAVEVDRAELSPGRDLPSGARVVLVSAIARPELFLASAQEAGFEVVDELRFPDHHDYPERSRERIREVWSQSGADAVLTTSKDRVKLLGKLSLPMAQLPIRAVPETAFWSWFEGEVARLLAMDF